MHVLMVSLDASILTQQIGNARQRHEYYAEQVGRLSMVICQRRSGSALTPYTSERVTAVPTNSLTYLNYLLDGPREGLALAQRNADQPVDVITAQDPFLTALIGLHLRSRLRVPLIIQDHSSFLESEHFTSETPRNRVLRWLATRTLPRADAVRVVNWREKTGCVQLGLPSDRVCVIPLVPAIAQFVTPVAADRRTAWRARIGAGPDDPVVLWVGRPVKFKNLPLLIRAFARVYAEIPAARLVLAGDMTGTDVPELIDKAGLRDCVTLPGAIPHAELPALYQACTLYALSSNYEGLPGVLLEASAAGLPIVSTANNGSRDLISDGDTGVLVPIGDEQALVGAMLDLIRDPARRAALGSAAQKAVLTRFDEQRLMTQWVSMWRNVAAGRLPCD